MKVHMFSGDKFGGAGRAAHRMHHALNKYTDINCELTVPSILNAGHGIQQLENRTKERVLSTIRPGLDRLPLKLLRDPENTLRSPAWLSAVSADEINAGDADIIHLHWTCAGFLSIKQIGRIKKPIVWSMHDMWAFCGAEHLASDSSSARWRNAYGSTGRPETERGFDVDKWAWHLKRKAWKNPMQITTPSCWLTNCVANSSLMKSWDVTTIPNTLDTELYKPQNKLFAREVFRLPADKKLILFGAFMGTALHHKGWDLLHAALQSLSAELQNAEVVIFGQHKPERPPELHMKAHWMGHIFDDTSLAMLYSAADVTVVPSRIESFGQTASESMACGCPVVAFDTTGLKDVVIHMKTGYLAKAFDPIDLADGIRLLVDDESLHKTLAKNSRERAVNLWSMQTVAPQLQNLYERTI